LLLAVATGDQLSVKPTKIAAGVEAEKTNELLQSLAKAINMKVGFLSLISQTVFFE
jgi:hypothetical protein